MPKTKEVKTINEVIGLTKDCLVVGQLKYEKIKDKLAMIGAVGIVVKDLIDIFGPEKPDPVMEKLKELENKIDKLNEKMVDQFDELKSFIVEHNFYADIVQTASTLTKFMADTLKNPVRDSYEIFRSMCLRTPPLQYAYKMISLLESEKTNPLKMEMKNKMPSHRIFRKWRLIFDGILSQFLVLETYLNGLFWDHNMYGPNQLSEAIENFTDKINEWFYAYQFNGDYWPDKVRRLVERTQDENTHVGNEAKADILQKALNDVITNDIFHILVYNDCGGYSEHSFNAREDQTIYSFRRGKCNIVIYRSRQFKIALTDARDRFEQEVESCRRIIPYRDEYAGYPGELMGSQIHDVNFVGMIQMRHNVAYRRANTKHPRGPGWWIDNVSVETRTSPFRHSFFFIAGYR